MSDAYFDVIVDVPALRDRRFTYRVRESVFLPYGAKVHVPFGRGQADGYVVGRVQEPEGVETKEILAVYDTRFLPPSRLLSFGCMLARHYCAPVASVWSCFWPPRVPKKPVSKIVSPCHPAEVARRDAGAGNEEVWDLERSGEGLSFLRRAGERAGYLIWGSREFRWRFYIQKIKEALEDKRGVIVVVPEVKRIESASKILEADLGSKAAILHSGLSDAVRRRTWFEILEGQRCLVLGTRSCVFSPVKDLGLIIVDEEESESHRAEDLPRYSAPEVAMLRADWENAAVILGSCHPSVVRYSQAGAGRLVLVREDRSSLTPLVRSQVIDLLAKGRGRGLITKEMYEELKCVFDGGKKALLFINRRGTSSTIICLDCGHAVTCKRCSVSLSYHAKKRELLCHVCGYRQPVPDVCPVCGGYRWKLVGAGTERVEEEFKKKFPQIPLFRLDQDVLEESSAETILSSFLQSSPACLVTTQLVLGYDDLLDVEAVGVLSCDSLLNLSDFRASERVFHLLSDLMEVARSSQSERRTSFLIQTYNRSHRAVQGVFDPEDFYRQELDSRRILRYPPFGHLFKVEFSGKSPERVREAALSFAARCEELEGDGELVEILGPCPAQIPKVRGQHRWQLALKAQDREALTDMCETAVSKTVLPSGVKISFEVEDSL